MADKQDISQETQQQAVPQQGNVQQRPQIIAPGQPMGQPPTMVIQMESRNASRIRENYNSRSSKALGIAQIVCGVLAIILNAAGTWIQTAAENDQNYYSNGYMGYYWYSTAAYYIGSGFWCSIFFFLSGAFAICSARSKRSCMIIAHMVLAIIASVCAFIMLGTACGAVGYDSARLTDGFHWNKYEYKGHDDRVDRRFIDQKAKEYGQGSLAVSVLFMLVSLVEVVACIWSSSLGCRVMCCCDTFDNQQAAQPRQYVTNTGGQSQFLVVDRRGRLIQNTQLIQTAGVTYGAQAGVIQMPQTNLGNPVPMSTTPMTVPASYPVQIGVGTAVVTQAPNQQVIQPPPYISGYM